MSVCVCVYSTDIYYICELEIKGCTRNEMKAKIDREKENGEKERYNENKKKRPKCVCVISIQPKQDIVTRFFFAQYCFNALKEYSDFHLLVWS